MFERWGGVEAARVGDRIVARVTLDGEPDGAYVYGASVLAYARDTGASPRLLHNARDVELEAREGDDTIPLGPGGCQVSWIEQRGEKWLSFQFVLRAEPPRELLARLACHRRRSMRWLAGTGPLADDAIEAALGRIAEAIAGFGDAGIDPARLRVRRNLAGVGTRAFDLEGFAAYRRDGGHREDAGLRRSADQDFRFFVEAEAVDVESRALVDAARRIVEAFPESLSESAQIAVVQLAVTGDHGLVRYLDRRGTSWRYPHAALDGPRTAFLDSNLDPYGPRRRQTYQTCEGPRVLPAGIARAAFASFLARGELGLAIDGVTTTADRDLGLSLVSRR